MALCWLLLILSALTADIGGVLLAVVAMLPVNILWRFRYWRAKATPFYGATYTGTTQDTRVVERQGVVFYGDGRSEGETYYETVTGPKYEVEYAAHGKRTLGAWIAGFLFPMRDAVRELRVARGGGPADPAAG